MLSKEVMQNALVEYSGFVGSTLLRQTGDLFTHHNRSCNIATLRGHDFDLVACHAIGKPLPTEPKSIEMYSAGLAALSTAIEATRNAYTWA